MLTTIFNTLMPVFSVILLGWAAGRRGIIPLAHCRSLTSFIMTFSLPALLFKFTAQVEPQVLMNRQILVSFTVGLMAVYIITFLFYRFILRHNRKIGGLASLTSSFPNFAFIGLPILMGLYGEESLIPVIISTLVGSLLLVPLTLIFLEDEDRGEGSKLMATGRKVIETFLNPVLLAPLVGIAVSFSGVRLPQGIYSSMALIGDPAPGLSLFAMGVTMSGYRIVISREVILMVFIKSILSPLVMFFITIAMGIQGILAREIVILGALPTATIAPMFSMKYGLYNMESSNATVVGTIFSVATLGGLITLYS